MNIATPAPATTQSSSDSRAGLRDKIAIRNLEFF